MIYSVSNVNYVFALDRIIRLFPLESYISTQDRAISLIGETNKLNTRSELLYFKSYIRADLTPLVGIYALKELEIDSVLPKRFWLMKYLSFLDY
jgi:hypothetical protein